MKLYSFALYFCLLNISCTFVATAIGTEVFLPEATYLAEQIPLNENLTGTLKSLEYSLKDFINNGTWDNVLGSALLAGKVLLDIINTVLIFLGSCITFLPDFLSGILGNFVGTDTQAKTLIDLLLYGGTVIIMAVGVFQLVLSKWFTFGE